jgi:ABC-2 type transport system ATP-binding protein
LDYGIETVNLVKKINNKKIIDNLNLAIPKGSIHGLIGSNGAGKTTTLKILSGLIKITSGKVRINGINISYSNEKFKEFIGYVPENPSLYEALTVREILELTATINLVPKEDAERKINYYLDLFQMKKLEDQFVGSLSKGEVQRTIISSVLLKKPLIYLFDEPFYSLDPRSQKVLRNILKEEKKQGSCILVATHLLDLAQNICDSFTLLEKGVSLFSGTIQELSNQYSVESLEEAYLTMSNHEV